MKKIMLTAASAVLLGACAASAPPTSWGKANVSRLDYGTDIGMCTGTAAMVTSGNGANTAGGISGQNNQAPRPTQGDSAKAAGPGADNNSVSTGAAFPTGGGGGAYRDSVPQDMVARAANQQQAQVMAEKRARADAFKSCITGRGYREFTLTTEQQAHLRTLATGSNEYHEYLYRLSADPAVLQSQHSAQP